MYPVFLGVRATAVAFPKVGLPPVEDIGTPENLDWFRKLCPPVAVRLG